MYTRSSKQQWQQQTDNRSSKPQRQHHTGTRLSTRQWNTRKQKRFGIASMWMYYHKTPLYMLLVISLSLCSVQACLCLLTVQVILFNITYHSSLLVTLGRFVVVCERPFDNETCIVSMMTLCSKYSAFSELKATL